MENFFGHTSKKRKYTREENLRFWKQKRDYTLENMLMEEEPGVKRPATFILDSSLITQTNFKTYSHKIVQCGKYLQVYKLSSTKQKMISKTEKVKHREKRIKDVESYETIETIEKDDFLHFKTNYEDSKFYRNLNDVEFEKKREEKRKEKENKEKTIDVKNINRSQNELKRLVKTNEHLFKTFITLTFEENLQSIESANKKFNSWRTYIKKLKNDFSYVCVPEFQKRGAVHYHLLTNIDYTDFSLLSKEERHIWSKKSGWQIGRDVAGWSHGLNMAKNMSSINVVNYIAKYMTKDIDNRLWGHRRYLYSQNLKKPVTSYLDLETSNIVDFLIYYDDIKEYTLNFEKKYADRNGEVIEFQEFKKIEVSADV